MRKKKTLYNVVFSILLYFITMFFTFATQALIVKILGVEYSGINGLFTNIITMLSIAELGIGSAIVYKLYDPISSGNKEQINSWLYFYKKCYRYVALFIFVVGIIIIPLIPVIVGETAIKDNLSILYLIYLLDVVFSYMMAHKRSLLYVDQKNYIISIVHIGYVVLMNTCQIIAIIYTQNYLLFLVLKLVYRLLENSIINIYVNKHYSYIRNIYIPLNEIEKKDIIKRIKAIFIQKISFVINKGIDNITISLFLGVTAVGLYTNYNLIATTLCGAVYQIVSASMASVGNLLTEKDSEKNYSIYKVINLLNTTFTAICVSGFICCVKPFISAWLGSSYTLSFSIMISFSLFIYSESIRRAITIYKEAAGICIEDKHVYFVMALINLVLSIILCRYIGISGVIIGTSISYLYLVFYSYPKYIFKKVFDKNPKYYYFEKIKHIFIIIFSSLISYLICNNIHKGNILGFIIGGFISFSISIIMMYISNRNTYEVNYLKEEIRKKVYIIKKRLR